MHLHIIPRKPNDFAKNDDIYNEIEKHNAVEGPRGAGKGIKVYALESQMPLSTTLIMLHHPDHLFVHLSFLSRSSYGG